MNYHKNLREAWGQALLELARRNPHVVALEADLGKSTRSILVKGEFPQRYFEMGIAEQNMASTAAGFALSGKIPFIHSFAVFVSGRIYDQLRNSVCIPNLNVRICGSSGGLSDFGDGKTHQAIEDVAIMRALPNMTVLCPADGIECAGMVAALESHRGPAYVRVNRNELPFVTAPDPPYHIGPANVLIKGTDAVVFACGVMVSRAIEAAERLQQSSISTAVVNVSTLKPIDLDTVVEQVRGKKAIVTAEEHSVIGGLGSAVLEALRRERHAPLEIVGVRDRFGISAADYDGLLEYFGLTSVAIEQAVRGLLV